MESLNNNINMALLEKVVVVAICLVISYMIVKHICTYLKIDKEPLTVLVTAATGEIGYALVPMIAQGAMLGKDQPVILHLLDTDDEAAQGSKAIQMELLGSAFPLLQGIIATSDVIEACKGVEIAIMLHELPLEEGMERKEVIAKNVLLYKAYASALDKHAADDCKVVVAAKPANTNALILKNIAPSIQAKNITCVTRLDHNRALAQISEKLGVHVSRVKNVVVWGNQSTSTEYLDANHAVVATNNVQRLVPELLGSDDQWIDGELMSVVQQRSTAVIRAGKRPSAFSSAKAICDHVHDWIHATPKGTWVSMGVCSDGSYGIESGLFYSFPVTCHNGEWSIVQGMKINESLRRKMDETMKELAQEWELAYEYIVDTPHDRSRM